MLKPFKQTVDPEQAPSSRHRYETLLRGHGAALQARALWLTRNRADADDLLQDTIERSMLSQRHVEGEEGLRRWLLVIMHNAFLDGRRSAAARRQAFNSEGPIEGLSLPEEEPMPFWRQVDDELLSQCLDQLGPTAASMTRMSLQGASYREIGARFGIPLPTVGTRLHRTRKHLRNMLCAALSTNYVPRAIPRNFRRAPRSKGTSATSQLSTHQED